MLNSKLLLRLLLLAALSTGANADYVCGAGWWHIGFRPDQPITIQTLDMFQDGSVEQFLIGGSILEANKYNDEFDADKAAVIFDYQTGTTHDSALSDAFIVQSIVGTDPNTGLATSPIHAIGVSAMVITATETDRAAFGVFETSLATD